MERIAFFALGIISIYSTVQVLMYVGWGTDILYNPFRAWMYMGPYKASRFANHFVIRAPGLYLEPSFNAFMIISLYMLCLLGGFRLWISSALALLALSAAQSMTGYLAFIVLWLLIAMKAIVVKKMPDKTELLKLGAVNIILATVFMFSGGVAGWVGINGGDRFAELGEPSTSGYYRLVAPLPILKDVLTRDPLGKPLGQMAQTVSVYHLLNGKHYGKTIDNGIYYLVFYFGWIAVVAVGLLAYKLLQLTFAPNQLRHFILIGYVFVSLQFSGGILLPEYILMLVLILYQVQFYESHENIVPVRGAGVRRSDIV